MSTYVAFLRAINVGGRSMIAMNDLSEMFQAAGGDRIRTYIQTGNVVFEASSAEAGRIIGRVQGRLRKALKSEPAIMLRTLGEMESLVKSVPFKRFASEQDAKMYVAFLSKAPRRRLALPVVSSAEALEVIGITGRDAFIVSRRKKNGFYGFPNNLIERVLAVEATTRNWSTVTKVLEFATRDTA